LKKTYKLLPKLLLVNLNNKLGKSKYKNKAAEAPTIVKIAGVNLIIRGKANSASTILTWFGCIKILLPKKSDPIPTNASLVIYPKKILQIAKNVKGIIALRDGS